MPYVNKKSLREEFDDLKSEFEKLTTENKITKESRVLFKAMLMLFDVMLVVFMEKTTKKDNRNSSKPSSQTQKDETSTVEGSKSKGKKENGELFANTRTKETIKRAAVNPCGTCGENLQKVPSQPYERRSKIDIIFEKVVCHVDAEVKQCPRCKANTKGRYARPVAIWPRHKSLFTQSVGRPDDLFEQDSKVDQDVDWNGDL